jgi:hypothetical protein
MMAAGIHGSEASIKSMIRRKTVSLAAGILAVSLATAGSQLRRIDENSLKNAGKTGEEWLTYGLDLAETRTRAVEARRIGSLNFGEPFDANHTRERDSFSSRER